MYERMLDKTLTPTLADLTAWCSDNAENLTRLNDWIAANFSLEQKIVFPYGKRYGWGIAHRKKSKLICNVFAERARIHRHDAPVRQAVPVRLCPVERVCTAICGSQISLRRRRLGTLPGHAASAHRGYSALAGRKNE